MTRFLSPSLLALLAWLGNAAAQSSWSIVKEDGDPAMQIHCDGSLVAKYHYEGADVWKPFFFPLVGPTGEGLTRGFPMDSRNDEETDHPYHRSLWFAHRMVNGIDFWTEPAPGTDPGQPAKVGRIVHVGFSTMRMGANPAMFTVRNEWRAPDGAKVCEDTRTYTFTKNEDGTLLLDWDITIKAPDTPVTFGDSKEALMGLRLAPGLRLLGQNDPDVPGTGSLLTSEGKRNGEVWGTRAAWVDASGLDRKGQPVGIAIFDHPTNLRHPTWWHARDYGLVAANPFGIQSFENKEKPEGELSVTAGGSLRFRYRLLLHKGTAEEARVAEAYEEYAKLP